MGKLKISINYHNIIPTASRPIKTGYLETVGRCWRLLLPGTKTLPPHQELPLSQCHNVVTMLATPVGWWLVPLLHLRLVSPSHKPSPPCPGHPCCRSLLGTVTYHLHIFTWFPNFTPHTLLCQSSISDIRKQMETAIKCNVSCRGDY